MSIIFKNLLSMRTDRLRWAAALLTILWTMAVVPLYGQPALRHIRKNPLFSASNYCIYPDSDILCQTQAPNGKKPFYISHYGRHGSRYLSNYNAYEIPYKILQRADTLDKLTDTGRRALYQLKAIIDDAEGRWGDLTGIGKKQQRDIAARMVENYPEVFRGKAFSTIITRCILSMGSAVQELIRNNPKLEVTMSGSYHDMWYLNHQDKMLRDSMMTSKAKRAFDNFTRERYPNEKLMPVLFNDTAYIRQHVSSDTLSYYLLKAAVIQQNTHMAKYGNELLKLFEENYIHHFWQSENAWWYINYGPSPLNGGLQPLTQRYLLRRMIEEADSIMATGQHGASLRFGHETVVLPLVCLLGINGYDYQETDLERLEEAGWWSCVVFPMASNVQIVFYRKNPHDKDVLIKVLLNEKETRLPLPDDMAPYYRWSDFRSYYLKKLADGESALSRERQRIHSHLLNHSQQTVGTGW